MNFFTPEDFEKRKTHQPFSTISTEAAAQVANEKLEKQGREVEIQHGYQASDWKHSKVFGEIVKSKVFLIPLDKCQHPKEKLREKYQARGLDYEWVQKCECGEIIRQCSHPKDKVNYIWGKSSKEDVSEFLCTCGKKVVPERFKEVDEKV